MKNYESMETKEWNERINFLTFAFQPIIDLRGNRIYGFEALLRNHQHIGFNHIYDIFDYAFQHKTLYGLDLLLREKLISLFVQIPEYQKRRILYNLDNRILEMPDFESGNTIKILQKYNLPNSSLVFEISERLPFQSYEILSKILLNYRNQGFKIAIDDFGVGYSSLQLIYSIEPDIIKLDRFFIYNINQDLRKKIFVEEIVKITHLIGGIVIAEGVETYDELLTCKNIGIDLVQGYYISKPFFIHEYDSHITRLKELLHDLEINNHFYINNKEHLISVQELKIDYIPPIINNMNFEDIMNHFNKHSDYHLFPVVNEHNEPLGIIKEKDFKKYYLQQYTRELLKYKDFSSFLKQHIVKVHFIESNTEIHNFFDLISNQELIDNNSIHEVIVTEMGRYKGVITSDSILRYVFKQKLIFAQDSNPLTNLPGNKSIKKYLDENIKFAGTFSIIYIDINNFKPYNDVFGFENGDKLIYFLGNILKRLTIDKNHYFVGHIGGDDFVLFVKNKNLTHILRIIIKIQNEFTNYVKVISGANFKNDHHFLAKNRFGVDQSFEYPNLSFGILFLKSGIIPINDLSTIMADLKYYAKYHSKKYIYYKIH